MLKFEKDIDDFINIYTRRTDVILTHHITLYVYFHINLKSDTIERWIYPNLGNDKYLLLPVCSEKQVQSDSWLPDKGKFKLDLERRSKSAISQLDSERRGKRGAYSWEDLIIPTGGLGSELRFGIDFKTTDTSDWLKISADLDPRAIRRNTPRGGERRKIGLPTLNSRPFFATCLPAPPPPPPPPVPLSLIFSRRCNAAGALVRRTESKAEHRVYVGR